MNTKKTVLLIDDDREEYELFCQALEQYNKNISCVHTYDCYACYNSVKDQKFDCIFLDYNMPVVNGFECLKKIKENPVLKDVPLYMFSASDVDKCIKELCIENGAIQWIEKPRSLQGYNTVFDEMCRQILH